MPRVFLKIFLFPLMGVLLAIAYPFYVADNFKEEEIKFEARTFGPDIQPDLKGVAETDWNGKRGFKVRGCSGFLPFSDTSKDYLFFADLLLSEVGRGCRKDKAPHQRFLLGRGSVKTHS